MKATRLAAVVGAVLLLVAGEARAECAWVLWTRLETSAERSDWTSGGSVYPTYSNCWARIHQVTGIAEDGTLADWYDWMRRLGRYRERAAGSVGAFESEGEVIVMTASSATRWKCLPETMDPRGPKGK